MGELVKQLFGDQVWRLVIRSLSLGLTSFETCWYPGKPRSLSFNIGLGMYSSCTLKAISHHLIVWWAAEQDGS